MSVSRVAAGTAALALSGLGVFGLQAPASAQSTAVAAPKPANCPAKYPPKPKPKPGKEHVHGKGYKHCSDVDVDVHSQTTFLGTLSADALGVVDGSVSLPSNLSPGAHTITLTGVSETGARVVTTIPVTVAGAAPGSNAGSGNGSGIGLPRTGTEIAGISGIGLVLVGAGGMAVYSGRRRRTTTA